jgi:hypothetical protein
MHWGQALEGLEKQMQRSRGRKILEPFKEVQEAAVGEGWR